MSPVKRILFKFIYAIVIILPYQKNLAFDSMGHEAIEKEAYRLLKNSANGETILEFLKKNSILYDDLDCHSTFPDFSLARQFAQDKQMYHFMASNRQVMDACRETGQTNQQRVLLKAALPACYESMYVFFSETILNGTGSKQAGRGIYVLMHIIADSYSSEHATRDQLSEEIITIKGWQLSRLSWPKQAKTLLPDSTLLLIHRTSHAKGDESWKSIDGKLSCSGTKAAEALRDLLILFYNSLQSPRDADLLYNNFIQKHFHPKDAKIQGHNFILTGTGDSLKYNYQTQFGLDRENEIYKFDRCPQFSWMLIYQTGSPAHLPGAYGLEFAHYITPKQADNTNAWRAQIPLSYGLVLTELAQFSKLNSFFKSLKTQAYISINLALPLVPIFLEPRLGVASLLFSDKKNLSIPYGFDLIANIFPDWGRVKHATKTIRLAIGYEHDNKGLPARNCVYLKIGFNTWQARFIKKNQFK